MAINMRAVKVVLIVVVTLAAYLPAIQGGFIWDDDDYVTENQTLRSMDGLINIWLSPKSIPQYYPLVHTSFWVEYQLWGLNPMGYHLVNVLLHIGAAFLLWRLLLLIGLPYAWMAAAVFALHPVQVESVAWVTERKNVLSMVFYLWAAICMIRCLYLAAELPPPQRYKVWYFGGMALFAAALLSKTVTCSLPAALLLLIWWRRGRIRPKEIALLAPFFVLGLFSGLSTAWLEQHHVGAQGAEWDYGWIERLLIAGRVIWFYGGKLIWPAELIFNYPRWSVDAMIWWQYLYPLALMALIATFWVLRRRIGRGALTAALFFCGALFPALGFIDVYPFRYSFVADHFQYHASIGFIVALVGAMGIFIDRLPKKALPVLVGILVMLLGGRTFYQCYDYADIESLWQRTIAKNPGSWLAHNNLGVILHSRGEDLKALAHYRAAIKSQPRYTEALNNIGSVYAGLGESEKALSYFKKALEVEPDNVLAHYNLGVEYADRREIIKAIGYYQKTLQMDNNYAMAHNNLGLLLAERGQFNIAVAHYRQALTTKPDLAEAHYNWGVAMLKQNRPESAVGHLRDALAIDSQYADARLQLGIAYSQQGELAAAIKQFEQVLAQNAGHIQARVNYGVALTKDGKVEKAVLQFKKALEIAPEKPEIHYNIGGTYSALGRWDEALHHFKRALQLKPDYYHACLNIGITLAQKDDLERAQRYFYRAVDIQPENALAYRYLTQAEWFAGQKQLARKTYKKLASLDPNQAMALAKLIPEISGF